MHGMQYRITVLGHAWANAHTSGTFGIGLVTRDHSVWHTWSGIITAGTAARAWQARAGAARQ